MGLKFEEALSSAVERILDYRTPSSLDLVELELKNAEVNLRFLFDLHEAGCLGIEDDQADAVVRT